MFDDPQEENTCGWNHWVRTQDAGGIIPKNQVTTPSWVLKRRLINDQAIGKILYISMSMRKMRLALDKDWICEWKRLCIQEFFSCGSANRIRDFGASNLDALKGCWEEQFLHFCFPNVGVRFILYILNVVEYV